MRTLFTALLCGAFFLTPPSGAVSRVGGGNGNRIFSPRNGAVAEVPSTFYSAMEDDTGLLMLQAPPAMTGKGPVDQILLVQDFDLQYPSLVGADAATLDRELRLRGFAPSGPVNNPCVKTWFKTTPKTHVLAMIWAPGQGLVVTGTQTPLVLETMDLMSRTLQIPTGACVWN